MNILSEVVQIKLKYDWSKENKQIYVFMVCGCMSDKGPEEKRIITSVANAGLYIVIWILFLFHQ